MKWRGVLFLRFLVTLVDESEKIRRLADFLFGNILKGHNASLAIICILLEVNIYIHHQTDFICNVFAAKAPLLAYNSFVEAIFVLNDCNAHTGHSSSQSSRSESRLFSIR